MFGIYLKALKAMLTKIQLELLGKNQMYGLTAQSPAWDGNYIIWLLQREGRCAVTSRRSLVGIVKKLSILTFALALIFLILGVGYDSSLKIVPVAFMIITFLLFILCSILNTYLKKLKDKHYLQIGLHFSGGLDNLSGRVLVNLPDTWLTYLAEIVGDRELKVNDYKNMVSLVSETRNATLLEIICMYRKLL